MLRRDAVSVLSIPSDVDNKSGDMSQSDGLKNQVDERYDGCEVSLGDVLLYCCCFQLHVSNATSLCSFRPLQVPRRDSMLRISRD